MVHRQNRRISHIHTTHTEVTQSKVVLHLYKNILGLYIYLFHTYVLKIQINKLKKTSKINNKANDMYSWYEEYENHNSRVYT